MIRELRKVDINKVAEIWLDTNIKTHYFIVVDLINYQNTDLLACL